MRVYIMLLLCAVLMIPIVQMLMLRVCTHKVWNDAKINITKKSQQRFGLKACRRVGVMW